MRLLYCSVTNDATLEQDVFRWSTRYRSVPHCTLRNTQDGFIHIAASGWISVNTEEKKNKHIQKVKNR